MSKRANPTVIGAFVVGAVIIAVAAVLILTSGQLFQKKLDFVMYFEGSVKGLNVGAPVSYRGVKIGTVKKIEIVLNPEEDAQIPVTVEIDPSAFTLVGYDRKPTLNEFREGIRDSCRNEGMRAQLQLQSLLTGQLFIQLDYHPDTAAHFVAGESVAEIPTVPTALQEIGKILQEYPLKTVLDNLAEAVAGLKKLTTNPRIGEAVQSVDQAFQDVSKLVADLDTRTEPLAPALVEAKQALAQATVTLIAAEKTFAEATETLSAMKQLVADDSEMLESLDGTLRAITEAAESVGALTRTLEQQPEAILKGKGSFGGD
jgi:paraquat-inducible protein B